MIHHMPQRAGVNAVAEAGYEIERDAAAQGPPLTCSFDRPLSLHHTVLLSVDQMQAHTGWCTANRYGKATCQRDCCSRVT
ncbi:MAG: hypothetical protein RLZZ153_1824, partial [Pseudomonadota bacterium]